MQINVELINHYVLIVAIWVLINNYVKVKDVVGNLQMVYKMLKVFHGAFILLDKMYVKILHIMVMLDQVLMIHSIKKCINFLMLILIFKEKVV